MNRPLRVLLTAGFGRAMHVLALAELLRRDGVEVAGLLVVTPYNVRRLRQVVRQRGAGFLRQAARRLLPFAAVREEAGGPAPDALAALLARHGIAPRSLRRWAAEHGVPYRTVDDLNGRRAVQFVAAARPDWVVYGGGGILRTPLLDAARGRVLNAHAGPLPAVRGMNACEWSLLLGYAPAVTIHVIDRGIDTGGPVAAVPVPVAPGDTVAALRARCAATGVEALRDVLRRPPDAPPPSLPDAAAHRQCFVLAPALLEVLERRLATGAAAPEEGDGAAVHAGEA